MTPEIIAALAAPFPPEAISWRPGSKLKSNPNRARALAYIDARDVMRRLDEVIGVDNWRDEYQEVAGFLICKLWIRIGDEWVWKCDGAGKSDIEAEKGMVSDSYKRAAVKWGIGRYLYDIDSPYVDLENGYIPDREKAKLRAILEQAGKPQKSQPITPIGKKQTTSQRAIAAMSAPPPPPDPFIDSHTGEVVDEIPDGDSIPFADDKANSDAVRRQLVGNLRDIENDPGNADLQKEFKARRDALWDRMTEEDQQVIDMESDRVREIVADTKKPAGRRKAGVAA